MTSAKDGQFFNPPFPPHGLQMSKLKLPLPILNSEHPNFILITVPTLFLSESFFVADFVTN